MSHSKFLQSWLVLAAILCSCSGAEARYSQSTIQQTVNEVSRPDRGVAAARPAHMRRKSSHWKTRYWNQKSTSKSKTQ